MITKDEIVELIEKVYSEAKVEDIEQADFAIVKKGEIKIFLYPYDREEIYVTTHKPKKVVIDNFEVNYINIIGTDLSKYTENPFFKEYIEWTLADKNMGLYPNDKLHKLIVIENRKFDGKEILNTIFSMDELKELFDKEYKIAEEKAIMKCPNEYLLFIFEHKSPELYKPPIN